MSIFAHGGDRLLYLCIYNNSNNNLKLVKNEKNPLN